MIKFAKDDIIGWIIDHHYKYYPDGDYDIENLYGQPRINEDDQWNFHFDFEWAHIVNDQSFGVYFSEGNKNILYVYPIDVYKVWLRNRYIDKIIY